MIANLLRALFRHLDRHRDPQLSAAFADDLMAIADATAEPEVAQMHREATPIGDAAFRAAIERACRIEAACEEWAAEVDALADVELAELLRSEGR